MQCCSCLKIREASVQPSFFSTSYHQPKSNSNETSTSTNSKLNTSDNGEKEKEKSAEDVHKPIVPFPNRLKSNKSNAQMEKIVKMFKQVKINVPLLDAL